MQMSEDLEAKIEAQMQETIESAKAVAEADARAASMHDAMMGALREQQAAEARAALLETRIRDEVAVRLRAIGSDRTLWPQVCHWPVPALNYSVSGFRLLCLPCIARGQH